jgi:hypothetical protein
MNTPATVAACVLGLVILVLSGCAGVVVLGIPLGFVTTEVVPRAVNGKGLVEDGVDVATGKDCRLIEGTVRDDRQICETRGSPATNKDFKGLSGLLDDPQPSGAP